MEYKVSNDNIHITDSYKITDADDMYSVLDSIRFAHPNCRVFKKRGYESMIREWKSHNRLYRLGLWKEHTKDVDLNWPQKWYEKVIYFILGL